MKNIKKLIVLADKFENKITGEYGGKGPFELPASHKAAMEVPDGGSSCSNCRFVDDVNHSCKNKYYIQWNGGSDKLPVDVPLTSYCSDWFEAK